MRSSHHVPKIRYAVIFLLLLFVLSNGVNSVYGQEDEQAIITLKLNRDFGFGLGGLMQGTFTLKATSPADLQRVDFMIDGEVIDNVRGDPFQTSINTSDFSMGNHRLQAVGITDSGQTIQSDVAIRQFVPGSTTRLVVILLVGLVLIGRFSAYLISRSSAKTEDSSRNFGFLGGAICPKCGEAFGIHWWSLRLGIRRYDRCSNCGKWSFVQRASANAITEANRHQLTPKQPSLHSQPEEKNQGSQYQKALDESRFDNS